MRKNAKLYAALEAKDRIDTLRKAIKETGLSHTGLAELLEVDVRTVRRWLEGTRKIDGPTNVLLSLLYFHGEDMVRLLSGVDM